MSLESATEAIRSKAALSPPLGYRAQFDFGDEGLIYWDGTKTPPEIGNTRGEADTTMRLSLENMEKLIAGDLSPTTAYMMGKLKVEGSMGVALKIGELLGE
jgi:putative sterol carrier protein